MAEVLKAFSFDDPDEQKLFDAVLSDLRGNIKFSGDGADIFLRQMEVAAAAVVFGNRYSSR
ncbi:MAG: hypothetical protein ACOX8R_02465 [Bacillota bacterium]|jgi:hypothetical protein